MGWEPALVTSPTVGPKCPEITLAARIGSSASTYVKGCEQYWLNMVTIMSNTTLAWTETLSYRSDSIYLHPTLPLLSPTLVRSVAVHSINTFFVFSVIFEWSPEKRRIKKFTKKAIKVIIVCRAPLPTIDDGRHGQNDTVAVVDDGIHRLVLDDGEKVLQVIVCLSEQPR